ncbi:Histidine triad nucleotide-binding protein 3 [Ranunculus cassubicifolius]
MEQSSRRRLTVLSSHLREIDLDSSKSISNVSTTANIDQQIKVKNNEERDCVFCKIIRGETPSFKVYEDDVCLCILDTNPLSSGHSLMIPKCHFSSLKSTPPSILASMCSKIPFVSSAIMKATNSDSFNLVVNNGAAAGQVIFHTHLHIVPRSDHDRLWRNETFGRQPLKLDQETVQLATCIREQLSTHTNSEEAQTQTQGINSLELSGAVQRN